MKAIIPCAEKEENLFPFSETKPTALVPIMGKELVKHNIESLKSCGVDEIYIITNYKEELFENHFDSRTDVNTVHQDELKGTASAVNTCNFIEDDIIVINGDVIVSKGDISKLLKKFKKTGETSVLATDENAPEKFGVLSIQNDEVVDIQEKPEKPENPLVNTGIYAFKENIFNVMEELEEDEHRITDAFSKIIGEDGVRFELIEDYWIDIGEGEKLWKADQIKRENHINEKKISEEAEIAESAEVKDKVVIEEGAKVQSGAVIQPYSYIGEKTVIGPNTVVNSSTISRDCQIEGAKIEKSLLFEKNIVDAYVKIENSVIGEECDVKSGSVIKESLIGGRSFIEMNNSILGTKFVPDARTDLGEISK